MLDQIPASVPIVQGEASLVNLIVELRFEIWNHLFNISNVPRSYGYTGLPARAMPPTPPSWPLLDPPKECQLPAINATLQEYHTQLQMLDAQNRRRLMMARHEQLRERFEGTKQWQHNEGVCQFGQAAPPMPVTVTRTHSMILVSKELGAEYRQAYHNRTNFFLRIDKHNVLRGVPQLIEDSPECLSIPNFWLMSNSFFDNVRHCTLYIELGDIEKALHPVRQHPRGVLEDTRFDNHMAGAIRALITAMRQLQSIHIVWATRLAERLPLTVMKDLKLPERSIKFADLVRGQEAIDNYNWKTYVGPLAAVLQQKASLRRFHIMIGDALADIEATSELGLNGLWPSIKK